MNDQSKTLLQALKASGPAPHYMTAAEGQELAALGYITVNANDTNGAGGFRVAITEAGSKALAGSSKFEIEEGIAVPVTVRSTKGLKPRESLYPFNHLEIGQSFHVPVTPKSPEPWVKMASNIAAANRKFRLPVEPQEMVQVTKKKIVMNEDGSRQKDADGKQVYEHYTVTEPKVADTKRFIGRQVDATDPKGPGCRVFRVELKV